jgi:flagellar biosynthesis GTPase FlhF
MNLDNLNVKERLPLAGVVTFAMGSVHSLRQMFGAWAQHDNAWLFWPLAAAIELTTAIIVWQLVGTLRVVTKSNQTKENRHFYGILAGILGVLALPSLATSVVANYIEFSGNYGLALLCPVMAVACAVMAAVPEAESRFLEMKETERKRAETRRKEKATEKERKRQQAEARRQQQEMEAEAERKRQEMERQAEEIRRQLFGSLGAAGQTLELYRANPKATQAEIAELAQCSERTIRNHINTLITAGLMRPNNGHGYEILADLS